MYDAALESVQKGTLHDSLFIRTVTTTAVLVGSLIEFGKSLCWDVVPFVLCDFDTI